MKLSVEVAENIKHCQKEFCSKLTSVTHSGSSYASNVLAQLGGIISL